MKIDLHFHTKSTKNEGRTLDRALIIENIISNNIAVIAITNHDIVDHDDFDDFKNLLQSKSFNFILFKGVELEILYENKKKHFVFIFSEELNREQIDYFIREVKDKSIDQLVLTLKLKDYKNKILVYPHGSKDKGLNSNEFKNIQDNFKNNDITLILDTNIAEDYRSLMNELDCLPSTDARTTTEYIKNIEKLKEIKQLPKNFEDMLSKIKGKQLLFNKLSNWDFDDVPIKIKEGENKDKEIGNISINEKGLNIIFGNRGTGKTQLLKQLSEFAISKSLNTVLIERDSGKYLEEIKNYNEKEVLRIFNEKFETFNFQRERKLDISTSPNYKNYIKINIEIKKNEDIVNKIEKYKISSSPEIPISKNQNLEKIINVKKQIDAIIETVEEVNKQLEQKISLDSISKFKKIIISKLLDLKKLELIIIIAKNLKDDITSVFNKHSKHTRGVISELGIYSYWGSTLKPNYETAKEINLKLIEVSELVNNTTTFESLPDDERLCIKSVIYCPSSFKKADDYKKSTKLSENELNFSNAKKLENAINDIMKKPFTYRGDANLDLQDNIVNIENILRIKTEYFKGETPKMPSKGQENLIILDYQLFKETEEKEIIFIDEIEDGLENSYITNALNDRIDDLIDNGKSVYLTTHNANAAILHESVRYIYCEGLEDHNIYTSKDGKDNMKNLKNESFVSWREKVITVLEGGEEALLKREKKYGIKY